MFLTSILKQGLTGSTYHTHTGRLPHSPALVDQQAVPAYLSPAVRQQRSPCPVCVPPRAAAAAVAAKAKKVQPAPSAPSGSAQGRSAQCRDSARGGPGQRQRGGLLAGRASHVDGQGVRVASLTTESKDRGARRRGSLEMQFTGQQSEQSVQQQHHPHVIVLLLLFLYFSTKSVNCNMGQIQAKPAQHTAKERSDRQTDRLGTESDWIALKRRLESEHRTSCCRSKNEVKRHLKTIANTTGKNGVGDRPRWYTLLLCRKRTHTHTQAGLRRHIHTQRYVGLGR